MKNIILSTALTIGCVASQAQTTQPVRQMKPLAPVSTVPVIQQANIVKPPQSATPPVGQADLKFTDFSVRIVDSSVVDGVKKCQINIVYAVTNAGTAPIATDNIRIIKYTCSEYWITRTQDLRFTNLFTVAGGEVMSSGGKFLAPGATVTQNQTYGIDFPRVPDPVMLITINVPDELNEKDKANNSTYKRILL